MREAVARQLGLGYDAIGQVTQWVGDLRELPFP
jgi:hypothetical protein